MPITLGYWKIRGLAANIRYQLAYSGIDYENVEYEQGDAPDFSRAPWLDHKFTLGLDFPNLPYLVDGDLKITETFAIHKYLADKYQPDLLGKTAETRATVNQLAGVIYDLKMKVTMPCYMGDGTNDAAIGEMKNRLPPIVAFLGQKKFLAGDDVVWLDFYLYELIQLMAFLNPDFKTDYPTLDAYQKNVGELPKVKEYVETSFETARTFNNKSAKVNN